MVLVQRLVYRQRQSVHPLVGSSVGRNLKLGAGAKQERAVFWASARQGKLDFERLGYEFACHDALRSLKR